MDVYVGLDFPSERLYSIDVLVIRYKMRKLVCICFVTVELMRENYAVVNTC